MKKMKFYFSGLAVLAVIGIMAVSCGKEETPNPPENAQIFYSANMLSVTFTPLVNNATSYNWDFGDGETSTEKQPTHTYKEGGYYTVTLEASNAGGSTTASVSFWVAGNKLEMLAGGSNTDGKAWNFSKQAGEGDAVIKADAGFTVDQPIPSGMLGLIGLDTTEYQDQFIFHKNGKYTHAVVNDSVIANAIYATINQIDFRPAPGEEAVGESPFTPGSNATFTFDEDVDLTLDVTSDDYPDSTWSVTWSGVDVFEIKNTDEENEFFGILDFTRKYIVFDITANSMQVGAFISATTGSKLNYPSHVVRMTYVPAAD